MALAHASTRSLYQSLNLNHQGDIRLVRMLGIREGKILCQLHTANLDGKPVYTALSYTWGPSTDKEKAEGMTSDPSHEIICNESSIRVTQNLHNFLYRAALDEGLASRDMWIDSISINQEDSLERANQVNQMGRIYRSAADVIVWLGEEEKNVSAAFALMRDLSRLHDDQLRQITPSAVLRKTSEALELLPGHDIEPSWRALSHLFRRKYFTRTWTLQELFLGLKKMGKCGPHSIDWECVTRISKYVTDTTWGRWLYNSAATESLHQVPNLIEATRRTKVTRESDLLLYALIRFRRYEVSDPRDKVFALLGLVSDSIKQSPRLRPAYKAHSVEDTYISAAIYLLEDSDHLLLLAHAEGSSRDNEKLPSWVPDWRCNDVVGLGITGYTRFTADGSVPRMLHVDKDKLTLTVRGARLDQIEHVAETKKDILEGKPFPRLLSIINMLPKSYHTGQTAFEVLWRSLITDTSGPPPQYPAFVGYAQIFLLWLWEKLQQTAHLVEPTLITQTIESMKQDLQECSMQPSIEDLGKDQYETTFSHSQRLRPFLSTNRFFGIGAESMQPGDALWIIAGCRVPLILRETDEGALRIVGGAYVHGFMNGEALRNEISWTDLTIV